MARESNKNIEKEIDLIKQFQWEFLRLNPGYISACEKFYSKNRDKWKRDIPILTIQSSLKDLEKYYKYKERIEQVENDWYLGSKRWGVNLPLNPLIKKKPFFVKICDDWGVKEVSSATVPLLPPREPHEYSILRVDWTMPKKYLEYQFGLLIKKNQSVLEGLDSFVTVTKSQIEKKNLSWKDISRKFVENKWVIDSYPTRILVKVCLDKKNYRMSKVFGNDFSKVLSILQSSLSVRAKSVLGLKKQERMVLVNDFFSKKNTEKPNIDKKRLNKLVKAYKLKYQENKSDAQIAHLLFQDGSDSAISKCRRYYNSANRLVLGGYKKPDLQC